MAYNIGWIIPRLRKTGRLWNCASTFTLAVVGLFSKFVIVWLNKTTLYNREGLHRAIHREKGMPLITVSNHHSCFDDPGLWGVLDCSVLKHSTMRWSLAAHDICFTNAAHSYFFALGKCVPVVRGAGVYQPAMDFCIERLQRGEWVHIFPEGRVNMEKEFIRLKWGVGRLVAECAESGRVPMVVPLWHEGMDGVLPNVEPYRLRTNAQAVVCVGEPVALGGLLRRLRRQGVSAEHMRRELTDRIQGELLRLRDRTHRLMAETPARVLLEKGGRTDVLVRAPDDGVLHDDECSSDGTHREELPRAHKPPDKRDT